MPDPTPAQIEWAADVFRSIEINTWDTNETLARRLLAEMERQGVKVTVRPDGRVTTNNPLVEWDAAPICPDHGDG